ncbi:MAG: ribosome rescue protein RqcH [Thermoplasmatota archaeon]
MLKVKQGLTNVDIAALAAELRGALVGGRFEKAYQPAKDQILLRFRRKGLGRLDVLFHLGKFVTITRNPPENPAQPSMVAKILRGTFENSRVLDVHQVGFDRLLRIDMEKQARMSLVLELFGDGNLLLLDAEDTILLPMRGADHGARKLRKGEVYQPPPGGAEPLRMDLEQLLEAKEAANKDVVRFLALDLGFGPLWAEELCLRAGVAKNTPAAEATPGHWEALHDAIQRLAQDITRNDLAPAVIHHGDAPIDAVPWPMQIYPEPKCAYEEAATFREALDAFFIGGPDEGDDDDPRRARFNEAKAKIERQIQQMQAKMDEFAADEAASRARGDALYLAWQQVEQILAQLQAARQTRSWQEVDAVLRKARAQGDPAAQVVTEIRPHNGTALLHLEPTGADPIDVEVDLYKSVQDNANDHFEAAKKAVSRQQGATKALDDARQRLADLEKKGLDAFGAAPKKADRTSRHFWFETYRWTLLPSGLLAVGGRNAAQNDAVVKKYLRDSDRYAHADIHGAPSVVIRPADGPSVDVDEADLRVACHFAAASSRAWRQFGAASAYWVTPAQVSKTPRSGEFVPKGAWIVHGKRNTESDLPMRWMVATVRLTLDGKPVPADAPDPDRFVWKVVGGPETGIKKWATQHVILEPGDEDVNDAAVRLAEHFDVDVEWVQGALPNGGVRQV